MVQQSAPTPAERVMAVRNLVFFLKSLIKGFRDCYFLGMLCWVSKTLYCSGVFDNNKKKKKKKNPPKSFSKRSELPGGP